MASMTRAAYRVRPSESADELFGDGLRRVYVGVSLGNPNFNGSRLQALIRWLNEHSDECLLVVAPELSRWTFMTEEGVNESEARAISRRKAVRQTAELRRALRREGMPRRFSIIQDGDLRSEPRFATALSQLDQLLREDKRFRDLVDESAQDYFSRRAAARRTRVDRDTALGYSRRFILEELALFAVLVSRGWSTEVYPGPELPVLDAVANGEFDGIPKELRERANVVLTIEDNEAAA
jgi:tRNA-dependent cyclodipeptide synthase